MKRYAALLLAVLMLGLLAACGGGGSAAQTQAPASGNNTQAPASDPTTPPAPADDTPADTAAPATQEPAGQDAPEEGYVFRTGGITITMNQDMAEVLNALGDPKEYFEAASCAFEGMDKTYTYPGFIITTRPEGDQDFINSLELTDDSVTTAEGLYIGNTADEVKAALGEPTTELTGALLYDNETTTLQFVIEEGIVTSICYLPVE